jgi:hypothetical protein
MEAGVFSSFVSGSILFLTAMDGRTNESARRVRKF